MGLVEGCDGTEKSKMQKDGILRGQARLLLVIIMNE